MRRLEEADGFLLRAATWFNVNWSGERFTFAQLDDDPRLSAYYRCAPDFGFVSTLAGEANGVVWVTRFPVDAPGYGFLDAEIPELSVCVLPGYRGGGVGATLVEAAVAEARHRSLTGLSLSVEDGNPARRLYERLGFAPVAPDRGPGTLFRRTRRGTVPGT